MYWCACALCSACMPLSVNDHKYRDLEILCLFYPVIHSHTHVQRSTCTHRQCRRNTQLNSLSVSFGCLVHSVPRTSIHRLIWDVCVYARVCGPFACVCVCKYRCCASVFYVYWHEWEVYSPFVLIVCEIDARDMKMASRRWYNCFYAISWVCEILNFAKTFAYCIGFVQ